MQEKKKMSAFVPNSFQVPNAWVDRFWHLLTSDEKDVLIYIARRIYGFHGKTCDGISLSQFVEGIVTRDGKRLDHGTGLSRGRVLKALTALKQYRFVIEKSPPIKFPAAKRRAAVYAIQLDSSLIEVEELEVRFEERRDVGRYRVQSANIAKELKKLSDLHSCGSTDEPQPEVSSHDTNNYQAKAINKSIRLSNVSNTNSYDDYSAYDSMYPKNIDDSDDYDFGDEP
jgi:hypothetical protein